MYKLLLLILKLLVGQKPECSQKGLLCAFAMGVDAILGSCKLLVSHKQKSVLCPLQAVTMSVKHKDARAVCLLKVLI